MADEAPEEQMPKGVGSLAKFFEAQMPSDVEPRRQSMLFPTKSQESSRRPSMENRRGPGYDASAASSPWSSKASSSSTLASGPRFGSQQHVGSSSDDMFKRRSVVGSSSSVRSSIINREPAEDTLGVKRVSVSRLSQMFDGGLDVYAANNRTIPGGPASLPQPFHTSHPTQLNRSVQRHATSPQSPNHPSNFDKSSSALASSHGSPKNQDQSQDRSETISVRQRAAVLAGSSSHIPGSMKAWSKSTSSIYIPRESAPLIVVEDDPANAPHPGPRTFTSPVPPISLPSSPAFKRARPPAVAPSPASQSTHALNGIDSTRLSMAPVLVMPVDPDARRARIVSDDRTDPSSLGSASQSPPPSSAESDSSPSPKGTADVAKAEVSKDQKRDNIIRELISTEKGYLKDMEVLLEVYAMPASESQILSERDLRNLFSNLDVIITTSRALLEMLEAAVGAPDQWIGEAFNQMMRKIETTYCEYCKHNEAAMAKLAEFASPECPPPVKEFLKECQAKLQGRTGAWDLGSLVIKPVQRVLKYPLLIKQLLKETMPDHPDFEQLTKAAADIELVAEKINEVKKRKDIVEKYVDGKGNVNVIHGFTKKWTRGTQQLKKATGIVGGLTSSDALYDALVEKLDQQLRDVQQLSVDLQNWLSRVKQVFELQEAVATALAELYAMDREKGAVNGATDSFYGVQEYQKACVRFSIVAWRDADNQVRNNIQPALDVLQKKFREPQMVMRKREQKLLDYERAAAIKARGEQVDKVLNESAEAYQSIHAQLIEELPRFLDLVAKYMDVVSVHIADLQAKLHAELIVHLKPIGELVGTSDGQIVDEFIAAMAPGASVEMSSRNIRLLTRWRESIWDNGMSIGPDPLFASHLSHSRQGSGIMDNEQSISRSSSYQGSLSRERSSPNSFAGQPMSRHASSDTSSKLIDLADSSAFAIPSPSYGNLSNHLHQPLVPSLYTPSQSATSLRLASRMRSPSPPIGFEAVALYDFEADLAEEVDLKEGDRIRVLEAEGRGGDWWFGIVDGREGWFPGTYVKRVEES
ncbi:hypothetical protein DFJ77DRAFT_505668 [Powellomyces hirtus]|nr:hypothetical protein DFJ77DRAFT_505668 [Powellomyces hirtus]